MFKLLPSKHVLLFSVETLKLVAFSIKYSKLLTLKFTENLFEMLNVLLEPDFWLILIP